jgi:glycosyltransferase involved in cell wall biosynthesis
MSERRPRILYLEPFDAGSHARFTRSLTAGVDADWTPITMPGRHWKWRMRGAAPWMAAAERDAMAGPFDLIWASSYVNLAELRGLLPHLAATPAVLYFHENQFAYPERPGHAAAFDLDFGYVQMVSALAATRLVFNSEWNRSSFLDGAERLLARMPDLRPPKWIETLRERSEVLPVPLELPDVAADALDESGADDRAAGPIVLWNHRWEHDKGPDAFVSALLRLHGEGVPFRVAVCGQRFRSVPASLENARAELDERIVHWGTAKTRAEYEALLGRAHIAVSSARQEFFGIALLEAVWHGARPLAPARLSYPELLPAEFLYPDDAALAEALIALCRDWVGGGTLRADRRELVYPYRDAALLPRYADLACRVAAPPA